MKKCRVCGGQIDVKNVDVEIAGVVVKGILRKAKAWEHLHLSASCLPSFWADGLLKKLGAINGGVSIFM